MAANTSILLQFWTFFPVSFKIFLISSGVNELLYCSSKATAPATCGVELLVPEHLIKFPDSEQPALLPFGFHLNDQILPPGANKSKLSALLELLIKSSDLVVAPT